MTVATLVAALLLAAAHLVGYRLAFLRAIPRSAWLSAAGGVSVAYVFVHLLPELEGRQAAFDEWPALAFLEHHAYVAALVGLVAFYGLERLVRVDEARGAEEGSRSAGVFWLHIASFAVYNALIGYLLVEGEAQGGREVLAVAIALGLHFVVNDHGLRQTHAEAYDRRGRWVLAATVLAGWGLAQVTTLDERLVAVLFALLGGSIVLNALKEELPEERQSRFWAFASGAAAYTLLLLWA